MIERGKDMKRIGRERTPAERSLANALERPEAAEYHGRCLYVARVGGDWQALSHEERAEWIAAAISMMKDHAEAHPAPPPPEPDGGIPVKGVA